ncbi:SWIM zinc finger family protein [Limnospira sp. PMC 289.06]|uniref:SWIM zinc finger family protein n=1 Tax=Limnospira sp. PMC 289.06 TaxID=2981094 RepID=UPI0028E0B3E6|nr:SWIM zinc finger family protein [Limnospira sp. PMC 289.06]
MNINTSKQSLTSLLYTKAAAARITGVSPRKIERVEIWWKVIFVVFKKGNRLRPRFVSKKAFHQDFQSFRQGNTAELELHPNPTGEGTKFAVINPKTDGVYLVTLSNRQLSCTCQDFEKQQEANDCLSLEMGKHAPRCKHIYKVLELGDIEFLESLSHDIDISPVDDNWLANDDWLSESDYSQVPAYW